MSMETPTIEVEEARYETSPDIGRLSTQIVMGPLASATTGADIIAVDEGLLVIYYPGDTPTAPEISSADYPVLEKVWDNPSDAIFDNM